MLVLSHHRSQFADGSDVESTSNSFQTRQESAPRQISISDARLQRNLSAANRSLRKLASLVVDDEEDCSQLNLLVDEIRHSLRKIDSDAARTHRRDPVLPDPNAGRTTVLKLHQSTFSENGEENGEEQE